MSPAAADATLPSLALQSPHITILTPMGYVTVVVVTDVRLYRDALEQSLSSCSSIVVHNVEFHPSATLEWLAEIRPQITLADVGLVCRANFVARVCAVFPGTKVVAFGVPESEEDIMACARAGAHGLVLRSAAGEELASTVLGVHRGELPCSPRLGALMYGALTRMPAQAADPKAVLTNREVQVLSLIEEGCSNKEIARRLFIGLPTAKNHVHNILEKLGVPRRSAAVAALHQRAKRVVS